MDDFARLLQTFQPSADSEDLAKEVLNGRFDPRIGSLMLRTVSSIVRFEGYTESLRQVAVERLLEAAKRAVEEISDIGEIREALVCAFETISALSKEATSGLEYSLLSALLSIRARMQVKGLSPEALELLLIGKRLAPAIADSDSVFEVLEGDFRDLVERYERRDWENVIRRMQGVIECVGERKSDCLSNLFCAALSPLATDDESLFRLFEGFAAKNITWFSQETQEILRTTYQTLCKQLKSTPLLSLKSVSKLTLQSEISDLVTSAINCPGKPPAVIKDDIKKVVVKHGVKDASEVFRALKERFSTADGPKEVAGCMAVLKAVQLSKNLSAEKMTELYNSIHKKHKEEPEKKHSGDEGEPVSQASYLCETLPFNPEDLPQILEKANRNAFAVIQAYMAKKSEFLKCVELFRLLETAVKEDLPGYSIHTFGSLAYGTWTKYSTVDVTLFNLSVSEYVIPLSTLQSSLKMHPDIKLDPVFKSKYPVLRIKRADSYFWVNITINNVMGLEVARLLNRYCELDPRVPELIIFVKIWAHINSIAQSKLGLPSGYSWTLLVLHFLMQMNVIPCLQARPHTPVVKEGCDVWVDEEKWEVTDKRSLGHLLMLFFYHYGVAVPQMSAVLDLRTGMINKIEPSPVLYPLIQPFEESRPLFTLHRSKDIGKKVVNTMRKSYNRLIQQLEVIRLN